MGEWNPDPEAVADISLKLQQCDQSKYLLVKSADGEQRRYMPAEIIREVRQGTDFGKEFYRLHLELRETMQYNQG